MLQLLKKIPNLDSLILKGVDSLINFIKDMVIEPLSLTIGGIPINLILFLILVASLIQFLYLNDKKHNGSVTQVIDEKIKSDKFAKWVVIGTFGLIGIILTL